MSDKPSACHPSLSAFYILVTNLLKSPGQAKLFSLPLQQPFLTQPSLSQSGLSDSLTATAMAFHVKQEWDEQYQSESSEHLYSSSKPPRLLFEQQHHSESAALPLFVSEPNNRMNNLSAFAADSTSTTTASSSRFARGVRGFFNLAQWQELELQALIFKYMLVKAPVPPQLIDSIKKTLPDNNPAFYLHQPLQQYQYFQQGMLRSGYWGNSIDPEPGRCRRTDGKKWRCAKDVVEGQKYCERHMHRGRNRSRKPVESSTPNGGLRTAAAQCAPYTREATATTHFVLAAPAPPSPLTTRSYAEIKSEQELSQENRTDGEQTLRQFFDINANPESFPTGLSISIPEDQQPSSDFSLKLATGSEENNNNKPSSQERKLVRWGSHQMGGPLAEALRQSASTSSSPTSVLLGQQARASGSDLSGVST